MSAKKPSPESRIKNNFYFRNHVYKKNLAYRAIYNEKIDKVMLCACSKPDEPFIESNLNDATDFIITEDGTKIPIREVFKLKGASKNFGEFFLAAKTILGSEVKVI